MTTGRCGAVALGLRLEPLESRLMLTVPAVLAISRAAPSSQYTSADSVAYNVAFSESVTGVSASAFRAVTSGPLATNAMPVVSGSGANYTVTVSGLHGSGQLRLDLIDTDTIVNSTMTPLGGPGLGNGSFQGQTYTIDQTAPFVQSIVRSNPLGPSTGAPTVYYTVTFSEPVTGVDTSDFTVSLAGSVTASALVGVYGSGAVYTVSVSNITGSGTLGLNLVDNGTIHDASGNPLASTTGNPSMSSAVNIAAGTVPIDVAIADFNGDGKPDLAAADFISNDLSIRMGNGNGSFSNQSTIAVGTNPSAIVSGDFNGDGKIDLAAANYGSGTISVLLGNGNGTFTAQASPTTGANPQSLVAADVNGDGRIDLIVANSGSNSVGVLLGNGDGTFQPQILTALPSSPAAVQAADVNRDGVPDLLVVSTTSNTVTVLLGIGDGTFSVQPAMPTGAGPESLATGDFNGDGLTDFAVANTDDNTVMVFLGSGTGSFNGFLPYPTGGHPQSVAVADMNGDGRMDLVVTNFDDNTVGILLGNADGSFMPQIPFSVGSNPQDAEVGDFNLDGRPDLAVANFLSSDLSIVMGAPNNFTGPSYTMDAATKLVFLSSPATTLAGATLGDTTGIRIAAYNAIDNIVIDNNSLVTLTLVGGTFSNGSTTAIAPAIAGIATFAELSINATGSYSLTASADALAPAASAAFDIVPAAQVVNRQLFYRGSTKYDVTNANLPGYSHDNAIAPDKTAYLPGTGSATFASVSSYLLGINGIVVDLAGPHGAISADDFTFRVGNNNNAATWSTAPSPASITVRAAAGAGGSDRIELIWADSAIVGKWLQVQLHGNDTAGGSDTNTGLVSTDTFYFGSAVGDSGFGDTSGFTVDSADVMSAQDDPHGLGNPAPITNVNDFNRDSFVNSTDQTIAKNHSTGALTQLIFFTDHVPPSSDAGGPYALIAGKDLQLQGAGTDLDPSAALQFSWDLNGDNVFGDATGATPLVTWSQLVVLGITGPTTINNVRISVFDGHNTTISAPTALQVVAPTEVLSRYLFYKNSAKWNVTNANMPGFSDDNAIAPDKSAYLPGSGNATFANVSSYTQGINGIMIDLAGTHGTITANDFVFKIGNNNSPSLWSMAPAPSAVIVRAGAGMLGSDRVELIWANGSIKGSWIEIIARGDDALGGANTNLGLATSDVFFYGSAPGDSGAGDATSFLVNSTDEIAARNDPHGLGNPATITTVTDYNRDGMVNSADQIFARSSATNLMTSLRFLNVGVAGPFAPQGAPLASAQAATTSDAALDAYFAAPEVDSVGSYALWALILDDLESATAARRLSILPLFPAGPGRRRWTAAD